MASLGEDVDGRAQDCGSPALPQTVATPSPQGLPPMMTDLSCSLAEREILVKQLRW
jgi:hypothetical protein